MQRHTHLRKSMLGKAALATAALGDCFSLPRFPRHKRLTAVTATGAALASNTGTRFSRITVTTTASLANGAPGFTSGTTDFVWTRVPIARMAVTDAVSTGTAINE